VTRIPRVMKIVAAGRPGPLKGTKNRISIARTCYNAAVETLNKFAKSYFGRFFCGKAGVEPREYFEATEQAKTQVPQVNFSAPQAQPQPQPVAP